MLLLLLVDCIYLVPYFSITLGDFFSVGWQEQSPSGEDKKEESMDVDASSCKVSGCISFSQKFLESMMLK